MSIKIEYRSEIVVELMQSMGGDEMVAHAAMVSTRGTQSKNPVAPERLKGLINYLMSHRHGTPFEHAAVTFFVHAPIFVWREWHRHRVGFSYNEQSARYMKLEPIFWIPERERPLIPAPDHTSARPHFIRASNQQYEEFTSALRRKYELVYDEYDHLVNVGYAKEAARAILPVGIYSACWVTCNPRSLMHFLSLRTHDDSAKFVSYPQHEIEVAARAVEQMFALAWPVTYDAWQSNGRIAP